MTPDPDKKICRVYVCPFFKILFRVMTVMWLTSAVLTNAADANERLLRDTKYYSVPPAANELGQHLFPDSEAKALSRSITFKDNGQENSALKSVSMPVLFHFGKTTIVEASQAFLDAVGEMMSKDEYSSRTLIVEGHTDAVGSDSSNQHLSELRALAIKDYLVNQYDIDPMRLFPTGKGETMLYRPDSPTDGANRRVEFLPYEKS